MKMTRKKLFGVFGGATVALAVGGVVIGGIGAHTTRTSYYETDGPEYESVADLAQQAQVVAQVRVVSVGKSYILPFDKAQVSVAPAPSGGPGEKANAKTGNNGGGSLRDGSEAVDPDAQAADASPFDDQAKGEGEGEGANVRVDESADENAMMEPGAAGERKSEKSPAGGIVKTDVTVEVMDVIGGQGMKKGDRIVITQLGGVTSDGERFANAEDPVAKQGDQEIMFLRKGTAGGKFFTVGGGQGRLALNGDTVQVVSAESKVARAVNGNQVSAIRSAVQAAK